MHEHYKSGEIPLPSDRSVGWVFAAVAAIVALLWRDNTAVWVPAAIICAGLLAISFTVPRILRPLNIVWFKFGLLLNKIVSPVVLLILFALVIVPAGLLMRLRYDPMRSKRRPDLDSYWLKRETHAGSDMKNQF